MKYENMSEDELSNIGVIVDHNNELPCIMCKKPARYIDCAEARVCGEECMDKWNEWLNEHCGKDSSLE
jgi:hypothetical protein